jgi:exopolysaccharide biosynthesis protein
MPQDKRSLKSWQIYSLSTLLLCLGVGLAWMSAKHFSRSSSALAESSQTQLALEAESTDVSMHQIYKLPEATVHVVKLPATAQLSIAVADELMPLADLAQRENARYAINGGFFDPQNGKTTSHLTLQGQIVGDPADNERLTGNPDLTSFLPQIFNRSEFRAYRCDSAETLTYDITAHDFPAPANCAIESAIGAGPMLLPTDSSFAEAFTDYENGDRTQGKLIRDALGSTQRNARSAIGLDAEGTVFLIMVEKTADSDGDSAAELQEGAVTDSQGMTLAEVTAFARSLHITQLLNLDGGSSSSLYIGAQDIGAQDIGAQEAGGQNGPQTYFGRLDPEGNPIERPVKSVIVIKSLQN